MALRAVLVRNTLLLIIFLPPFIGDFASWKEYILESQKTGRRSTKEAPLTKHTISSRTSSTLHMNRSSKSFENSKFSRGSWRGLLEERNIQMQNGLKITSLFTHWIILWKRGELHYIFRNFVSVWPQTVDLCLISNRWGFQA